MVLVAYRHGLRASELVDLRWDQIDFNAATMAVRRLKKGTPAAHLIRGDELRALRRLQREQKPSPFVFTSERCAPFTPAGFARIIERLGEAAGLGFKPHPHMLRHACGFTLANKGYVCPRVNMVASAWPASCVYLLGAQPVEIAKQPESGLYIFVLGQVSSPSLMHLAGSESVLQVSLADMVENSFCG
jgi:Phage integrase family